MQAWRKAGILLVGAAMLTAAAPLPGPDAQLRKLYTEEYAWRQRQQAPNEDSPKDQKLGLPDIGPAAQAERLARWTATLSALGKIDPAKLSPAERVNYAVFKGQIEALLNEQQYRDYEKPLNADSSFWGDLAESARGDFVREKDYRRYLATLRDIPRYFDQQIVNMRAGLKRGFTPSRITLQGRDAGVAKVAEAKSPADSPFFAPFSKFPAGMPAATQAKLRAEGEAAIREAVVPAHAKLLRFLRDEYIPGARTALAAYDLPDGRAYYQSKVAEYTTLDQTPEQVHAIGLAEVAKIRARMHDVMQQVGFKGDLAAFLKFLRTDPQFYAKTPQALLDRGAWIAKTFDGKASKYFGRLPRSRFAIIPVPDDIAPFYTGGRGGPGVYLINTYNLPARPLYSLPALTLHESAPGHAARTAAPIFAVGQAADPQLIKFALAPGEPRIVDRRLLPVALFGDVGSEFVDSHDHHALPGPHQFAGEIGTAREHRHYHPPRDLQRRVGHRSR